MHVNMLLYHLLYDLVFLFQVPIGWYLSPGAFLWQECICCTFIAVAGACSPFSHNNLRRAGKLLLCAMVITAGHLPGHGPARRCGSGCSI